MESIERAAAGGMPAHAEDLGEAEAHLLAAYIYASSRAIETARNQRWAVSRPGDERHEATKTEKAVIAGTTVAVETDAVQEALYAERQRVDPREVHGVLANWRVAMVFATLGLYYSPPWINWAQTGRRF